MLRGSDEARIDTAADVIVRVGKDRLIWPVSVMAYVPYGFE